MAELYINKKIDSLGRIVIPKEIRKKMHIIENENLDITLENDKVVIKKSSNDLYNKRIFEIIIDTLKKNLDINLGIFNINRIQFDKSNIELKDIDFKEFIINKKTLFDEYEIFPINPNGILYGGLILNNKDNNELNQKICKCFQKFIEKYLEE